MGYFKKIAPGIVNESIERSTTNNPRIDLYDEDFYLNQIKGHFFETDLQEIIDIIKEHKLKIDQIFLEQYKTHEK